MNYHALLLIDKMHSNRNIYSSKASNINQNSLLKCKNNIITNNYNQNKVKYRKCYSVKPYEYMMPKDIFLKDIFQNALKSSNEYIINFHINNTPNTYNKENNANIDRQYIFEKIKKFILINNINFSILGKTIFLYDLLCFKKEKMNKINYFINFNSLPNLSIALIAFILMLKFNNEEKKMISLKTFVKKFEEGEENIIFNEVCEMEIMALQLIDYNLTFQNPFSFMELFLLNGIIFNEDYINSDLSFKIYDLVNETLEKIMEKSNEYFKYNFFHLCCSIVMHIREKFRLIRWPKPLEINFDVNQEQFSDIYQIFFTKNNNCNNNIKSFYNADIINISNLKSMSNIINVLKIMKSADKFRKNKEKGNQLNFFINKGNKDNKEEENCKDCKDYKDNKNNGLDNNSSKIKVGMRKKKNLVIFKSPAKITMAKNSILSILSKISEENKKNCSQLYKNRINKEFEKGNDNNNTIEDNNIEEKKEDYNQNNKEKEIKKKDMKNFSIDFFKKDSFNIEEKDKYKITKSCNRYKKNNLNVNNKSSQESINWNKNINIKIDIDKKYDNNSNIEGNFCKKISNPNIYRKRYYFTKKSNNVLKEYPEENKEIQNEANNRNINSYNVAIKKNILRKKVNNRFYSNFTSKKRSYEFNTDIMDNNNLNITSFNDFLFYKNKKIKNNDKDKDKDDKEYSDNFKLKIKEENSNAPTCESSNIKISSNDFSIRKTYRLKKKNITNDERSIEKLDLSPKKDKNDNSNNEKEEIKLLEKNKSYNQLMDSKITFSDKTYNRKTGVRKYYKQKNLLENHYK